MSKELTEMVDEMTFARVISGVFEYPLLIVRVSFSLRKWMPQRNAAKT
jgi:hypothetical protein